MPRKATSPNPQATTAKKQTGQTARDRKQPLDLGRALAEAFLTNEQINQTLLELIDPKIWRATPPSSKRRNIATSFAHIHNVRVMRLGMSAKGAKLPRLDRANVTPSQAKQALTESSNAMIRLIEDSLADGGHVYNYPPSVVALVCWAITHDAHHRGQICHWAREVGAPLTPEQQLELWDWNKLRKQALANS